MRTQVKNYKTLNVIARLQAQSDSSIKSAVFYFTFKKTIW